MLYRYFCYSLLFVVILNSAFNFIQINMISYLSSINFYDLTTGLLLFTFLYLVGNLVKKILKFDSVSVGIIAYLFSFFIIDSLILFFYQQLSFMDVVFIVNLLWLSFFIFKSWNFPNSMEEVNLVKPISFAHIDVDTYISAKESLEYLSAHAIKGALIILDDFGGWFTDGVTKLGNELKSNKQYFVAPNHLGQLLIYKI